MGRVTFQEFRLADLHTMSATARHGSDTLGFKDTRTHATEDQTHRLRPSRCGDHFETSPVDDPRSQSSNCKADAKQTGELIVFYKQYLAKDRRQLIVRQTCPGAAESAVFCAFLPLI
jgi:hypothetical protein